MNPCVFLDRDGVINKDYPNYVYKVSRFEILEGVTQSLAKLKESGFLLIVITNQSGISLGIYTIEDMRSCHAYLQKKCGNLIDHFYFSPYHPSVTNSLSRKPKTLLFEKAISKYQIDVHSSWMIGDRERDLIPAKELKIKTIKVGNGESTTYADYQANDLVKATQIILQ